MISESKACLENPSNFKLSGYVWPVSCAEMSSTPSKRGSNAALKDHHAKTRKGKDGPIVDESVVKFAEILKNYETGLSYPDVYF